MQATRFTKEQAMTLRALPLLLACAAAHAAAAPTGTMVPGNWEYTMRAGVPGAPVSLPGVTTTVCLTSQDVPYGVATTGPGSKGDCRFENWQQIGRKTRYDMVCGASGRHTGHFEFEATATTVVGQGRIDTGSSALSQQWSGRRLGDCR
jgi:hypothetical protein